MITSVAEKAGNASSPGDNRACSDRESRKDRGSNGVLSTEGRVCLTKPTYHEGRQEQ